MFPTEQLCLTYFHAVLFGLKGDVAAKTKKPVCCLELFFVCPHPPSFDVGHTLPHAALSKFCVWTDILLGPHELGALSLEVESTGFGVRKAWGQLLSLSWPQLLYLSNGKITELPLEKVR